MKSTSLVRAVLLTLATIPLLVPQHIQAIGWMRMIGNRGILTLWLAEGGSTFDDFTCRSAGPARCSIVKGAAQ